MIVVVLGLQASWLAHEFLSKTTGQYNDAGESCQCPANDYNSDSLEDS